MTYALKNKGGIGRTTEGKYYESSDCPGQPWRLVDLTKQETATSRPNSNFTMINLKTGEAFSASDKRAWSITKETFNYYYQKGTIVFPGDYEFLNITKPYFRKFKYEDEQSGKLNAAISDFQLAEFLKALQFNCKNKDGNNEIEKLFGRKEFDFAKPENLIKSIIDVTTEEGDLVMDFFLGSGTTCAVAHKMNRHYIGVEQMDYIETLAVERLKQVINGENGGISKAVGWNGGGSFVYFKLAKLNQKYIDLIEKLDESQLEKLLDEILNSGFISNKTGLVRIGKNKDEFNKLTRAEKKQLLVEAPDKNQLYINYCDIDDENFEFSDTDKAFTKSFYRRG